MEPPTSQTNTWCIRPQDHGAGLLLETLNMYIKVSCLFQLMHITEVTNNLYNNNTLIQDMLYGWQNKLKEWHFKVNGVTGMGVKSNSVTFVTDKCKKNVCLIAENLWTVSFEACIYKKSAQNITLAHKIFMALSFSLIYELCFIFLSVCLPSHFFNVMASGGLHSLIYITVHSP